jgi:type IV pilus assembly protein PilE
MKLNRNIKGMSLIELMIALAIVAIIAAVGIPAYQNQLISAKRDEAKMTLLQLKLQQENYRLENTSYASAAELGSPTSENYTISVANVSATTYTITATAKDNNQQKNDTGCTELSIDQSMNRTPASCW